MHFRRPPTLVEKDYENGPFFTPSLRHFEIYGQLLRQKYFQMKPLPLFLLLILLPCLRAEECPDDWFETGNPDLGCFYFGETAKSWVEAHEECEESIGHMAEATTLEQVSS